MPLGIAPREPGAATLTIANSGPAAATAVSVELSLPPSVHLAAASGSGWSCGVAAPGATCSRSLLAVGSAPPITIVVNPLSDGLVTASASVSAFEDDPAPANNGDVAETLVEASAFADLELSLALTGAVRPGMPVAYTLVVTNAGPDGVVDAPVSFVLPLALLGPSWTCSASPGATCSVAGNGSFLDTVDLPAGGSVTYAVAGTLSPAAAGILSAEATVVGPVGTSDPDPLDNRVRHATAILGQTIFVDDFESGDLAAWSRFQ